MEEWKDIIGYEGLYQVSNLGNIKSLDRYVIDKGIKSFRRGIKLKPYFNNKSKFVGIGLCKNGKYKTHVLKKLVAVHFLKKENSLAKYIIHKDRNIYNCAAENLYWSERSANSGETHYNAKIKENIALEIKAIILSNKEIENHVPIKKSEISHIKRNHRWKYLGKGITSREIFKEELVLRKAEVLSFIRKFKRRPKKDTEGKYEKEMFNWYNSVRKNCDNFINEVKIILKEFKND